MLIDDQLCNIEVVKDINQDQFLDEVIEKSKTIPVIASYFCP